MPTYDAYIFDLDGTLLDSKRDIATAANATIRHMGGTELPDEHIYEFVGRGARDLVRSAVSQVPGVSVDAALSFFNDSYEKNCLEYSVLYDGVLKTLDHLRAQKKKMAILTNKPQRFTDIIMRGLKLTSYFDVILGGEAGHPHKPNSATTHFVLSQLGVTAEKTLMVGDSVVDYDTARLVNMDSALVTYGFSAEAEIRALGERGARVIQRFDEILSL